MDLLLYKDQNIYCAPGCYEYKCDPGKVIWVGQGLTWGVKSYKDPAERACIIGFDDCRYNDQDSDFLRVSHINLVPDLISCFCHRKLILEIKM